ncbi:MAG: ORF6N domain-containing protein [Bacteroidota bacterium]
MEQLIPYEIIEQRIFLIRGQKVMIDRHLAELYAVPTKSLNLAVKRNIEKFPEEFMFRLTKEEYDSLRFQFETLKRGKHSKYLPYAFTEHGVAMAANVLKSERATRMSILIVKAFVKLRAVISTHKELAAQLKLLESKVDKHDAAIQSIIEAIKQLMQPPNPPRKPIGFKIRKNKKNEY